MEKQTNITVAARVSADDYRLLAKMIGTRGCKRMSDVIRLCLEPAILAESQKEFEADKKEQARLKRVAKKAAANDIS